MSQSHRNKGGTTDEAFQCFLCVVDYTDNFFPLVTFVNINIKLTGFND